MHVSDLRQRAARIAAILLLGSSAAVSAGAQTLLLNDANATTIRGGSYANTAYGSATTFETRASDTATYVRRGILKFDTATTIPQGTPIASATLTLTIAGGNSETRAIDAYRVTNPYDELQATWNQRNSSTKWTTAGGDLGEKYGTQPVTNVAGSKVTYDVTALVQGVVNGTFGSRYTRIALVDAGAGATSSSYKQYYSDEAADPAVRPTLTVVLAPAPVTDPGPTPTTTSVTLRVLQWNLHHGVGTDGKYDIDRIATWMAKLTPDVITANEVERYTGWGNEDQPARYAALLQAKTGKKWYAHFAQEFGNWSSPGKGHLILSVYPFDVTDHVTITPSSGLKGAGAASMVGLTVNGRRISVIVSHLDPDSQTMRLIQAKDVIAWGLTLPENRILTGDMNAWPDQSSILEYNKTYKDSWAVAEANGTAVQFAGLTPSGATKKGRIDYIFYSKTAPDLAVKGSRVYDTRDASGIMPSDHRPVLTTFTVK